MKSKTMLSRVISNDATPSTEVLFLEGEERTGPLVSLL